MTVAVIGAGSWAVGSHLPNLERWRDDVEFTIVNRRDPVILERIRERFCFERASTDWQDVIAAEPDLVVIASPAAAHAEQALAALRDARADGAVDNREAEVEFVRAWVRRGPPAREEG